MMFLIAALNRILVGSFWIGAGSASHTLTPRNKGLLTYNHGQARTCGGGGSRGSDDPPPPHLTTACHLHIVFTSTNLDFDILECKN